VFYNNVSWLRGANSSAFDSLVSSLDKRCKDLLKEMLSTRRVKVSDKDSASSTVARRMVKGKRQKMGLSNGHCAIGGDAISNNNNLNMDEQY